MNPGISRIRVLLINEETTKREGTPTSLKADFRTVSGSDLDELIVQARQDIEFAQAFAASIGKRKSSFELIAESNLELLMSEVRNREDLKRRAADTSK